MSTTLPAHQTSRERLTPIKVAVTLLTAAKLIELHGHYREGDYWPESAHQDWAPGMPLCLTGAIAVALGHRNAEAAAADLHGALPVTHPALAAVMAFLDVNTPEEVFGFSDSTPAAVVTYALHGAAADLRAA